MKGVRWPKEYDLFFESMGGYLSELLQGPTPDCNLPLAARSAATTPRLHYDRPLMLTISSKVDLYLRLPDDNSSSAFRPVAGGTGSLPCYWREALPQ